MTSQYALCSQNPPPAGVREQCHEHSTAANKNANGGAPEANDTLLQRALQIHAKYSSHNCAEGGSKAADRECQL